MIQIATWTTPKTMNVGDVGVSADWNTHVRDNMNVGRGYLKKVRTAGNVTAASTAWANFDTGTDIVLPAAINDVIQVDIGAFYDNNFSDTDDIALDVVTIVAASPVNSFATGGAISATSQGYAGWYSGKGNAASIGGPMKGGGSCCYTVVSGDISGGNVTLRVRVRQFTRVSGRVIDCSADQVFFVTARNCGPAVNI